MEWLGRAKVWIRGGLAALGVILALWAGHLEWLELRALNGLFELRGPRPPRAPIVVVSIDDDSFDELDMPWPWPRALHGRFLEEVAAGGPAAVGFDVLFIEPSSRGPEDDAALAQGMARAGNVVLAAALTRVQDTLGVKEDLNPPLRALREHALGFGVANMTADDDAFVRRATLSVVHQNRAFSSLDLQLYQLAVKAGIPAAPLPVAEFVYINYRGGPRTFPTIPYYRILNGEIDPAELRGKIVLVGATSPTLHDVFPTPFAPKGTMPGVEIHANVLETLLEGIAVRRIPRAFTVVLLLVAAVTAVWVTAEARALLAMAAVAGLGLAYGVVGAAAFVWTSVWLDQVAVPLALLLGYGVTTVESFFLVQREKQRLSRFFSPGVLREVVRAGHELGRTRKLITVLFSDIRGFTPIAEKLSPEEVAEFLREYMTSMTEAVFQHGGIVTQFVGDEIMALYNAPFDQPDHAAEAVRTGLEFQERVKELAARWEPRVGLPIRNGVGINTGEAVVGIVGSAQRVEYGAIGDTINLGSRLEGLTKEFPTPIIIAESTYERVKESFVCRSLGEVAVKGKEIRVKIYGVEAAGRTRAQRVTLGIPLTITATTADLSVTVAASLSDLSLTGLRATEVPRRLDKNQVVGLHFELPGLPGPVATEGRIMWSTDDQAGIRFLQLSADEERGVRQFLETRAGPAPAAGVEAAGVARPEEVQKTGG